MKNDHNTYNESLKKRRMNVIPKPARFYWELREEGLPRKAATWACKTYDRAYRAAFEL